MRLFSGRPACDRSQAFELDCLQVGNALVVAPPGSSRPSVAQWAGVLPADPARVTVILDLPSPDNPWTWNAVANALRGRGALRLVGAHTGSGDASCARWLADELDVEVVAPDGTLRQAGAGVFVEGGCWRSFSRATAPLQLGTRFPEPEWENGLRVPDLGEDVIVEHIPAGLWLHRATDVDRFHETVHALPYRFDALTVVVGVPGASAVRTDAVATLFSALPPAVRAVARLAPFGSRVDGRMLGQVVADVLGEPVVSYAGLPGDEVVAFDDDGSPGWRPFATHLGYEPTSTGFAQPVVLGRRAPFDDVRAPGPAVYPLWDGIVAEVLQSGLWVRTKADPPSAARVRAMPLDPEWIRVVVGDLDAATPPDLAAAATRLIERLDADDRRAVRPMFGAPPKARPARTDPPEPETPKVEQAPQPEPAPRIVVESPSRVDTATSAEPDKPIVARLTPVQRPAVVDIALPEPQEPDQPAESADPVEPFEEAEVFEAIEANRRSTPEEREWLRRALGPEYDTYAGAVIRMMSRQPGLRAVEGEPLEAVVADLVAVQVYLSGADTAIGNLRPYACCLASGLQRLPSHRGPALHAGAGIAKAVPGSVVSHKRFFNAVSTPTAALPGDAEFLVWSTTGRRVDDIDQSGATGRIVFLPDSRFKVLDVRSGRVFLSEVVEADAGGTITERDQRILARLDRVADARDARGKTGNSPVLTAEKQPWVLDGLDLAATA